MRGEELAIAVLLKEHKRLVKLAEKAKELFESANNAGMDLIKLRQQLRPTMAISDPKKKLAALDKLISEETRLQKLHKMDVMKLIDKRITAENNAQSLGSYVGAIQFRIDIQRKNRAKTR